jgi:DNA polymerase-3 subunit delta
VVEIKDLRISASGYRDTLGEDDLPQLERYFADPSPRSIVIFIADELNGVRKAGKFLREKAVAVEFKPLTDKDLAVWAKKEFASSGTSIDDLTLKYFLSRMENDVLRMTNEVKKLSVAAQPEGVVTSDLIDSIVANARTLTNFELTDHLVAGRSRQAIMTLRKILDDGAEPVALLGLLSYNYRRLLMAKDMMDRGAERRDVANTLQLRYNDQEPFLAAARRAKTEALTRAIKLLANTDLAIKTSLGGSDSSRLQIEMLVCQLALP